MIRVFFYTVCCCVLLSLNVYAQQVATTPPAETNSTPVGINQTDAEGRRQGIWYYKTEALRGEPAVIATGNYSGGRKMGTWYTFDTEWQPISILKYFRGVLNGEAQYFENGKLVCVGHWRGLNPDITHDTIWVYDPSTDNDFEVVVPTEQGTMKHGIWKYYSATTGLMLREEEYQVGDVIWFVDYAPQDFIEEKKKKAKEAAMLHNKANRSSKPFKVKRSITR